MSVAEIVVAVAQVAAGGTIVQGLVALVRRRTELRKLDRESEAVAVETADKLVVMLRADLATVRTERDNLARQVETLGEEIARARSALAIARAQARLVHGTTHGTGHEYDDPGTAP